MISVSTYVHQYAHMLMIAYFLPIEAAAYYGLAIGLSGQVRSFLGAVVEVFYPAATNIHFGSDRIALERLYNDGTRLMLLILIPVVLVASFWAEDFYRIWIGEKYLAGSPLPSVALLLRITLIGTAAMYASGIAGQILLGSGRVVLVAKCVTLEAALNLILSLITIRSYGLVGVAVSGVIASLIVRLVVIPVALQKALGLRVKHVLRSACLRPAAVGVLLATVVVCIQHIGRRPEDWFHLILQGALAGASVAAAVLVVGVTTEERRRFLVQPLRRLLKR
jgi:O-antigen/teichoic acid export membrane protein